MVVPRPIRVLLICALAFTAIPMQNATAEELPNIRYATVDGQELLLDLYLPDEIDNPKLIVWVHGGAWRSGSRTSMPLKDLIDKGYAIASVDYRLSPVARFPAQIHDIKAAIRFLRAHASKYGYDPQSIAIAGASAGGHLVALVGVTNGNSELEGRVGDHLDQSSDVQAIIDLYGPTNLTTILPQSTPHGLGVRIPALQLLLGGQPEDKTELAELASPVFHVDASDPPLLMMHGDQDPQVPINQSLELLGRYEALSLPFELEIIHGGVHGGPPFYDSARIELMADFLQKSLK
ncbi:alpha/beta hydrolase [Thalassoglobus sp. JC818]|uniref:alpha/beta hydrolase n=1 Tax=Thalassoglobus sp. JC818 TaxID=3232136 RepID=UPI00345794E5